VHDEMMMKENRKLSKYPFVEVKPTHKALDHDVTVLGRRCGIGIGAEADPCTPKGSKQPRPPVGPFLQFPLGRQLDGGAVVCRKSLHCRLQMEDKDLGGTGDADAGHGAGDCDGMVGPQFIVRGVMR
jgi:hypothetical protein